MSLERICSKAVVTISPDATVLEATKLMQSKHIGCLVVIDESRPIGILTDRDIVLKVVASEKKPAETAVKEIMTTNPTMVNVNRTWSRRAQTKSSLLDKERETFLIATLSEPSGGFAADSGAAPLKPAVDMICIAKSSVNVGPVTVKKP